MKELELLVLSLPRILLQVLEMLEYSIDPATGTQVDFAKDALPGKNSQNVSFPLEYYE